MQGAFNAADLREIKVGEDDFGLMSYDPAFLNTASCRSAITYIGGDRGILRYRGYPIEELAEKSSFLEVAYLLLNAVLASTPGVQAFELLTGASPQDLPAPMTEGTALPASASALAGRW